MVALILIAIFAFGCVFFTAVGVIGLFRLPDIYTRAHAVSKADTLGAGFALLGVALSFGISVEAMKAMVLFAIIFVTNPTAIHALTRSAFSHNVPFWVRQEAPERRENP